MVFSYTSLFVIRKVAGVGIVLGITLHSLCLIMMLCASSMMLLGGSALPAIAISLPMTLQGVVVAAVSPAFILYNNKEHVMNSSSRAITP